MRNDLVAHLLRVSRLIPHTEQPGLSSQFIFRFWGIPHLPALSFLQFPPHYQPLWQSHILCSGTWTKSSRTPHLTSIYLLSLLGSCFQAVLTYPSTGLGSGLGNKIIYRRKSSTTEMNSMARQQKHTCRSPRNVDLGVLSQRHLRWKLRSGLTKNASSRSFGSYPKEADH